MYQFFFKGISHEKIANKGTFKPLKPFVSEGQVIKM